MKDLDLYGKVGGVLISPDEWIKRFSNGVGINKRYVPTNLSLDEMIRNIKCEVDEIWKDELESIHETLAAIFGKEEKDNFLFPIIYMYHLKDKLGLLLRRNELEDLNFEGLRDDTFLLDNRNNEEQLLSKKDVFLNYVSDSNNQIDYEYVKTKDDPLWDNYLASYSIEPGNEASNFYKFLESFNIWSTRGFRNEKSGYITTDLAYALAYLYKRKQAENKCKKKFLKKYEKGKIGTIVFKEYLLFIQEFREFLLHRKDYILQVKQFSPYDVPPKTDWVDIIKTRSDLPLPECELQCEIEFMIEKTFKFHQFMELSALRRKFLSAKISEEKQREIFDILFTQIQGNDCVNNLCIMRFLNSLKTKNMYNDVKKYLMGIKSFSTYLNHIIERCYEEIESTQDTVLGVEDNCLSTCHAFVLSHLRDTTVQLNNDFLNKDFKYILKEYQIYLCKIGISMSD
ncbi:hypothetical protein [Turicibacter sp. KK003]|uniref:hypothetical protein n=1 Tax=Turicibacter sp. KK003 TaxID=3114695 RepID=UPI0030CB29C9